MNVSVITTQTQMLTLVLEQATELALEAINNTLEQATQGKAETVHPTERGASSIHSHSFQPVLLHVRMEGHSMKGPVHVTVQMATVGQLVEVSALCRMDPCWLHRMS